MNYKLFRKIEECNANNSTDEDVLLKNVAIYLHGSAYRQHKSNAGSSSQPPEAGTASSSEESDKEAPLPKGHQGELRLKPKDQLQYDNFKQWIKNNRMDDDSWNTLDNEDDGE